MIDILAAIESVVDAATALDASRRHGDCAGRESVAGAALALAVPAGRRRPAAVALLEGVRTEPAQTAQAFDCTLGAVLVWRAVDRAERAGQPALEAAETGLRTALAYLELASQERFAAAGVDQRGRHAALAILEIQARLALSRPMEETA
jgi:hypothetical protein